MCGGIYDNWEIPKQMSLINNERVVERTIRLLQENNINDIAISSNNDIFLQFNVPLLKHDNKFHAYHKNRGYWADAFYPMTTPVCYLMGDVVFSPNAIKTIVQTETQDVEFFASAPPFHDLYIKKWAEPFAFKVFNTEHFFNSIKIFKRYQDENRFNRPPISWELWQVIKNTPINKIDYTNYVIINDYTCDIDTPQDISKLDNIVKI